MGEWFFVILFCIVGAFVGIFLELEDGIERKKELCKRASIGNFVMSVAVFCWY